MANKKYKTGIDLEGDVKLSNKPANRALVLDSSNNVVESTTTDTQIGYLSDVTEAVQAAIDAKVPNAEKGIANGVATLDGGGKVPSSQLPNSIMDYKGNWNASTNTPTLADGVGNADEDIGDVYRVGVVGSQDLGSGNISFDVGDYVILNSSKIWEKSDTTDAVASVNSKIGVVVIDPDDLDDAATTNKFTNVSDITKLGHISVTQAVNLDTMESDIALNNADRHAILTLNADSTTQQTLNLSVQEMQVNQVTTSTDGAMSSEDKTKLDGIEALADVTDSTNVDAAGAVMEVDTSTANMSFVIDEDDMSSDSDTKVPTQQSVKAYVDSTSSNGDLLETSFVAVDNQAVVANVTGLSFANGVVRSFKAHISIVRASTYEIYEILGIQKGVDWDISQTGVGDDTGVEFSITPAGQIQYTSTSTGSAATLKFRAETTSV